MDNEDADVASIETSPEDYIPEELKKFKSTDDDVQEVVEATSAKEETEAPEQAGAAQPKMYPEEEVLTLKEQLDQTRKQLAASDRKVTELSRQGKTDPILAEDVGYLKKQIGILTKSQAGSYDVGSAEEAMQKLDAEHEKARQQLQQRAEYEQHLIESRDEIWEELRDAGIDPNGNDPKATEIRAAFNENVGQMKPLGSLVRQARQAAKEKAKGFDIEAERAKIREEEKKKLHEERKTSPELKVVTGSPSATPSTKAKVLDEYNRGLRGSGDPEVKKYLGL